MTENKYIKPMLIFICIIILAIIGIIIFNKTNKNKTLIDDWKYSASEYQSESIGKTSGLMNSTVNFSSPQMGMAMDSISSATIGLSTGGAKDINNFRENIENNYFPISTDITYNGLFYDYSFDTGKKEESKELFSPAFSTAISKDPISNEKEYYMTVGLNSNIKESDFERKKLNLVVVLDISGSMDSSFDSYYYDDPFNSEKENKTKMKVANESVNILIDRLKEDDRFGMVLFDDRAYLGKPISLVGETDIKAIKNHILEIEAQGGTNFEEGYRKATTLFKEYKNVDSNEYENRIIVITDAMPNYGETSKEGLLKYVNNNSEEGIYTTFIGVGVDFNTELIEMISDVKGANYYAVHNSKEFEERMGEQFEYMVTPLVFDLELNLDSKDYEISAVYGSDTYNKETGNLMNVNTLFPSKTNETGEVKGGVVLLKLNKKTSNTSGEIKLDVSYKDRNGKEYNNSGIVTLEDKEEYYENTGIRKAIILSRYANTLKNWILYERSEENRFIILPTTGITDCILTTEEVKILLGENERTSVNLTVSTEYKEIFRKIKDYINTENTHIKDETFNQEIKILDKLINH